MRKNTLKLFWILTAVMFMLPIILASIEKVPVIDFGNYEKRILKEYSSLNTNQKFYNKDGSPNYILNPEVMALSNWKVEMKSSGLRNKNIQKLRVLKVFSKQSKQDVLGVRINFPQSRQNDRAIIKPQFDFHVYDKKGNFTNITNGVIVNVGIVKEVSMWVKGRNYPFDVAVRMEDENHKIREYFFGNLLFDNWRRLIWVNPNYLENIKDRVLIRKPLYPKDIPYLRFKSIVVYRQMDQIGGDFILYVRNINIEYEIYTTTIADNDIDDEKLWNIMKNKAVRQMKKEQKRLADKADVYRREQRRLKQKQNK